MRAALLVLLPLAGCAPSPPLRTMAAPSPRFDALAFFAGRTEGDGRLKVIASRTKTIRVYGTGTVDPDGTLHLIQRVDQEGKPETRRAWTMQRAGEASYAGTLSDAEGPIVGDVEGNRLHLRFRMPHGLNVEQWLYLQPGAQRARNRITVRKFGLVVATLDETITRLP